MSQQDILTLAKQGDPRAIATLLNRSTQPHGITVKAARQHYDLFLLIEADQVPEEAGMMALIRQAMVKLEVGSVRTVKVFGRQTGNKTAIWNQDLKLPLDELDLMELEPVVEPEPDQALLEEPALAAELAEQDAVDDLSLDGALESVAPADATPADSDDFATAFDSWMEESTATSDVLEVKDSSADLEPLNLDDTSLAPELPELIEPTVENDPADFTTSSEPLEAELPESGESLASNELTEAFNDSMAELQTLESDQPDEGVDLATDAEQQTLEPEQLDERMELATDADELTEAFNDSMAELQTLESDQPDEGVDLATDAEQQTLELTDADRVSEALESNDLDAGLEVLETDILPAVPADPQFEPDESDAVPLPTASASDWGMDPTESEDLWVETVVPSRDIAAPESMYFLPEPPLVSSSPEAPAEIPVAEPAAPTMPNDTGMSEIPWQESEVRALLQRPEAVAVLLFAVLITLWDAYFQVLDESEWADGALSGRALARRLGTSASTVRRRREKADFSEWTQPLDPEGIAWMYRDDGKFVPRR